MAEQARSFSKSCLGARHVFASGLIVLALFTKLLSLAGQRPPLQQDKPCPFINDTNEQPNLRAEKERFKYVTSTELSKMSKGLTPANTTKPTNWALKAFEHIATKGCEL